MVSTHVSDSLDSKCDSLNPEAGHYAGIYDSTLKVITVTSVNILFNLSFMITFLVTAILA
jgi:hypothetical protein